MYRKCAFLVLAAGFCLISSAQAATIVWVSFHGADDAPAAAAAGVGFTQAPDKGYTDLLKANGYDVVRYVSTGTPNPAVLNAADLVIISRSVPSSHYQNAGATAWNGISAPMMIVNGYVLRNSRLGYTTGGTVVDTTGDITLTVTDPTHPIFAGISLTNGTMNNPYAGMVVLPTDGVTVSRGISINDNPLNDEATVLATISAAGNGPVGGMVIAEWRAGAALTHAGGAGTDVLTSPRLVFLTGSREPSGVTGGEAAGLYDLYDDGTLMFLNAVRYMIEIAPARAYGPTPSDKAVITDTYVNLGWSRGDFAVSHDVYLGESFDDVNAGTADTFRGNHASTLLFVGLGLPGDPYPGGLVPGTTYYWRIDEVNTANPNSPWKGDIWSFSIPSKKACEPIPSDGAKYQNPDVTLSWTPGLNAKLHYVYFGDNFDQVSNDTVGTPAGSATYRPAGPLAKGKTYYWRVDEFDGGATHKGEVWSLSVIPDFPVADPNLVAWYKFDAGEGTRIVDFSGRNNHGTVVDAVLHVDSLFSTGLAFTGDSGGYITLPAATLALTNQKGSVAMWINTHQTDDEGMIWYACDATGGDGFGSEDEMHVNMDDDGGGQIRFYVEGGDGGSGDASINVNWSYNDQWIHVAATWDPVDGLRLYINGTLAGSAPHNNVGNPKSFISLRLGHANSGDRKYDGLLDDVRVFNYAISPAKVAEIMNKGEDPLRAGSPRPGTGAVVAVTDALPLSWSRGEKASQHDVYFGLDKAALAGADASDTTGVYRGRQSTTSYSPAEGVAWGGGPYYWRIDEVNSDGTVTVGSVWNFSVADYLIVDDIESYNDLAETDPASNRIYVNWIDGFGTTTNGAFVGNLDVPLTERSNTHSGAQAMPLSYDNNFKFSEATLTLKAGKNWTREGVANLSLWFRGAATNAAERMYVALNGTAVVYHPDPAAVQLDTWTEWVIPLQQFSALGVNLANVTSITIGFGTRGNTTVAGGTGQMYFDDIRLYRPASAP